MKLQLEKLKLRKKNKTKIDYFSLSNKVKIKLIAIFSLKWGLIILIPSFLIWILLYYLTDFSGFYFFLYISPYSLMIRAPVGFSGSIFFQYSLQIIPALLLIIGGCLGGLSRYNVPPKMRIVEPDDQAVTPSNFQIRIKYDPSDIDPTSISIVINEKKIQGKLDETTSHLIVPKIFKSPPKKTVTMLIEATAIRKSGKEVSDKIRIICDPESDEEDYIEYWEFKREDDTYWGKEMKAAAGHARRNFVSLQLMTLAIVLLAVNALVTQIFMMITGSPF